MTIEDIRKISDAINSIRDNDDDTETIILSVTDLLIDGTSTVETTLPALRPTNRDSESTVAWKQFSASPVSNNL